MPLGEGYFHGYEPPWKHAVTRAALPGVTPHTLRHTMGSMTLSSGEAMAFAGAISGHANPRSTAIYAHVQHDPAKQVADGISERIADALAGVEAIVTGEDREKAASDEQLLTDVAKVLANDNQDAELSNGVQKGPPIGVEEGPPFRI